VHHWAGPKGGSFLDRSGEAHSQDVVKYYQLRTWEMPVRLSMLVYDCGRISTGRALAHIETNRAGSRAPFFVGLGCRVGVDIYIPQVEKRKRKREAQEMNS
jgi:methionine synthase I (cobalamin-dependent)